MRVRGALASVGVLAVTLAGCAQPGGPGLGGASGPTGPAGADSFGVVGSPWGEPCDNAPAPEEAPLPADAVLARATRCVFGEENVPGDGVWRVRFEQEATTGLDALAAALRLPSKEPGPGTACTAIAYAPIVIMVTDSSGRQLRPAVPHGVCGEPLVQARDAITAVSWTTVAKTQVSRLRSELEVTSGCSGDFKPMIAIIAAEGPGSRRATVDTTPRALRVCRYEVGDDPNQTLDMRNGVVLHGGKLSSASTLDAAAAGELLAAIAEAPGVTGACATLESPFAVIYPVDGGAFLTVELGGCHRANVDADGQLRALDPTLVARLLG